ncbi:putative short-subunit dehydrogenase-like oxidoreductase (DUF2520 family) [Stackebrandtia albiflava]|uniref:Putative short-subunit dehydrogenase-like oxidoreductase (DUF2520 family) n=1 Tax=Stackebrandtia albiflava TaxID=406432 RepID=A0A562V169_9ACTN|nr:DUF2520 domain-containing protein [Stackebrandtia albiflava]TWJ11666.1 putative short-subunit dehydrogenase-like oxidoreductase (DUF2520 family) [Stackebrandtia albiflava]
MAMSPTGVARPGEAASRLDVGIVSAGRVGTALGIALARAGHRVVAACAVSEESRSRAARLPATTEILPADQVAARADLLLLAVPDTAIAGLVAGLASGGHLQPGQLVAHTSGAHGVEVLRPAAGVGCLTMALHPVMTFTGRGEDVDRLAGISFGVTAPEPLRPVAAALVLEMGGEPEFVDEAARPLYHAALSHGTNHLNTLVNEAMDLLRAAGIAHPDRLIAPLLSASLDNTLRLGDRALTGPVARGDADTVAAHLTAVEAVSPESIPAYLAMARRTADRAIASGRLSVESAEPLLGVLARREQGGDT